MEKNISFAAQFSTMYKLTSLLLVLLFIASLLHAQNTLPKINASDPSLPGWVKMMYDEKSNVFLVDSAYQAFYNGNKPHNDIYARWYTNWRRKVSPFLDEKGYVHYPGTEETNLQLAYRNSLQSTLRSNWQHAGPEIHYSAKSSETSPFEPISEHANIYGVDRSLSNPNVLIAGSESGGIYKSVDAGENWNLVTPDLLIFTSRAVRIHPTNENEMLFAGGGKLYKTSDGGATWATIGDPAFQNLNFWADDLLYNPGNPDIIYIGTDKGMFRTTDGGLNWTEILLNYCISINVKPGDPSVIYALQYDPATKISYFYKSIDFGATFTKYSDGWFEVPVADAGKIESYGGRIAVTEANPEKVYVLLVGSSQTSAQLQLGGFIGTYVSNNAGESWSNPHGLIGAPYDFDTHPCLMDFDGHSADYNQIYYNTFIIASHLDENRILIGGLNMWRSDDGAASYQGVGGYIGGLPLMHVDIQTMRNYKTSETTEEVWWSSDGGINHSTDFLETHQSKCKGILATELWGYDQGWNEDIMVGGRYHNGNMGFLEGYPEREFLALGGGEAPTGYANYSHERKVYFSDIGSVTLPETIDGITDYSGSSGQPNESYYQGESSRIVFDWNNYHTAYMGKENKLYKSNDGGSSFYSIYSFGTNSNQRVLWIEQSRVNTQILYVQQLQSSKSVLWKTVDGGINWSQVTLPLANQKYLNFTLSGTDENGLWLSFTNGGNGSKIYYSDNGGTGWTNLTTAALNNFNIWSLAHQFGTNGGVYLAMKQGIVFYRNNNMPDWEVYGDGLPAVAEPLRIVPFYKGNKIRLATWHVGVWENDLYETSELIADFAIGNQTIYCSGDTIFFTDHSVASAAATFQWSFPGAIPSTSVEKNPAVVYAVPGTYDVTLTINDGSLTENITKTYVVDGVIVQPLPIVEDFEAGQFNPNWLLTQWNLEDAVGGYGQSDHCMFFDNYNSDLQGGFADVQTGKYALTGFTDASLVFDIAYQPYGFPYVDTLEILASTDCGNTFTSLYKHGGNDLATVNGNNSNYFIPENDEWRTDTVSLDLFAGNPEVVLAFRNIGYYGNVMYIDNINVTSSTISGIAEAGDDAVFQVFPNPNNGQFILKPQSFKKGVMQITILNAVGKIVSNYPSEIYKPGQQLPIDLGIFGKGIYFIKVETLHGVIVEKVIVQ
ncbi:MAG: T9SS type A sorting domain-containing protein [Chitinophagaceae bacterium]|nr:T9SS type A sorting domain-containing protein [Chitinophagaceae bacterium]